MIKLVDVKYLPEKDVYEISKESIVKSNTEFRMMKLQRDELINDMQNVKRKAEAFDEIEGLVSKTKSPEDLGECVLQLLIENKEANHER